MIKLFFSYFSLLHRLILLGIIVGIMVSVSVIPGILLAVFNAIAYDNSVINSERHLMAIQLFGLLTCLGCAIFALFYAFRLIVSRGLLQTELALVQEALNNHFNTESAKTIPDLRSFFQGPVLGLGSLFVMLSSVLVGLFLIDFVLAAYVFVFVGLCIGLAMLHVYKHFKQALSLSDNYLSNMFSAIDVIKANRAIGSYFYRWKQFFKRDVHIYSNNKKIEFVVARLSRLTHFLIVLVLVFMTFFVGHPILMGEFFAFFVMLIWISELMHSFTKQIILFQNQRHTYLFIQDVINAFHSRCSNLESSINVPGSAPSTQTSEHYVDISPTDALEPGTIYSNLISNLNSQGLALDHGLALTGLDVLIERFPMGIQTVVTERGQTFSSGEIFLILLTRAVLNKPKRLRVDSRVPGLALVDLVGLKKALKKEGIVLSVNAFSS